MDNLVAKQRDEKSCSGNDDNACPARHVVVHGMEELGTDNDVDGGPAYAGKDVEDGNCSFVQSPPHLQTELIGKTY